VNPIGRTQAEFGSYPIFETLTPLGISASVTCCSEFDTVDLIRATHDAAAFAGGAAGYTTDPVASAPYYRLHWAMHAEGLSGIAIPAPGELNIFGRNIDPATGLPGGTALILGRVVNPGIILAFGLDTARRLHRGSVSLGGARYISVVYRNGGVAQTVFQLGIYLRAI